MKAFHIAWKDTLGRFRDWKALAGMLAAPLVISALIGLAFGGIASGDSPVENINIAVVNLDEGELGQTYIDVLTDPDLDDLLNVRQIDNLDEAQQEIENGVLRAVVYIPPSFSEDILPDQADGASASLGHSTVEVFTDPAADISPFIIQSIIERISAGLNTVLLASDISARSVADYAAILGPQMAGLGEAVESELGQENFSFEQPRLALNIVETGETGEDFDPYAFFIPGMAVFFLMFTMFEGSHSILLEESRGTLPRLMTTPTPTSQIILGKMGGTFLTGVLQFTVLVIASSILFGINWGNSLIGVFTIMVLTVFAASGIGAMLTAFARNEQQAAIIGGAVSLIFGALGGSFFPTQGLGGVLNVASKLTVNRWAMDGFNKLTTLGGTFSDILTEAGVLALMGLVTFTLALWAFNRRFVK
jgi:ABC-2 type transport system permease protein